MHLNAAGKQMQEQSPTVIAVPDSRRKRAFATRLRLPLERLGAQVHTSLVAARSAQFTQYRAHGTARRRAGGMLVPQASQTPYSPVFILSNASSISCRMRRSRSKVDRIKCVVKLRFASAP